MITLNCLHCQNSFSVMAYRKGSAKYCSKTCHAIVTIAGKNKHLNYVHCKRCKKQYQIPNSQLKRTKYCSRLCQNRQQAEDTKTSGRILGNKNPMYKNGIQLYRKIAKQNLPWKCNKCNSINQLLVHHLDHNRQNNNISNLEVLCRRCHQIKHECWKHLPSLKNKDIKPSVVVYPLQPILET